ncbi:L-seryl-tRNA(Sec) selenium transferase [soil metagenome]
MSDPRRRIPSVDRLLGSEAFAALLRERPRDLVVATLQEELARVRDTLGGQHLDLDVLGDPEWFALRVASAMDALVLGSLHPVLNATGVVLHTNLGRAPLASAALDAIRAVAQGYSTLEYDIASGARGSRYAHCRDLIMRVTGAADALVVNNNAAALVLALNTASRGQEAVISRGELVEIGGAFRVPEIMERSGARLREVGATNRTHLEDYETALSSHTGAILKVHPSNFTIRGYTAEVGVDELARLADRAGVPLIHDIGSGLLVDPLLLGLPTEPTPADSLNDGAHIVTMSGDKLLGGPQCGIILGSTHWIERLRTNPLCRALRVDKLTLAALAATLRIYLDPSAALREIPVLRMLSLPPTVLAERAEGFAARCRAAGVPASTAAGFSAVGGGASPAAELHTTLVLFDGVDMPAQQLEGRLRTGRPAVIARVSDNAVSLDLRTIPPDADGALLDALLRALRVDSAPAL